MIGEGSLATTSERRRVHFDRMIVLDFETTGLQPGYRPVEIAWIEFDAEFRSLAEVHSLVDPQIPIEPGAQRTHGISPEMVEGRPTLSQFLATSHPGKFTNEHVLVVAHNARYDVPMLEPFCGRVTSLCTMQLSQSLYPDAPDHRLQTIVETLALDISPNHRALADATACLQVLQTIARRQSANVDQLLAMTKQASLDSVMPFGKHKGMKLKDLPDSYAAWCIENLDHDHWVRLALLAR